MRVNRQRAARFGMKRGMNWAKNKGISDGSAPNRNITREQLAAMLYRYAGEPDGAADLSAYADAGSVSAYAEKAVQWCVKNGILTGKTSSTLAPKATAPRGGGGCVAGFRCL